MGESTSPTTEKLSARFEALIESYDAAIAALEPLRDDHAHPGRHAALAALEGHRHLLILAREHATTMVPFAEPGYPEPFPATAAQHEEEQKRNEGGVIATKGALTLLRRIVDREDITIANLGQQYLAVAALAAAQLILPAGEAFVPTWRAREFLKEIDERFGSEQVAAMLPRAGG